MPLWFPMERQVLADSPASLPPAFGSLLVSLGAAQPVYSPLLAVVLALVPHLPAPGSGYLRSGNISNRIPGAPGTRSTAGPSFYGFLSS